jgi:uncharacterized protein (TIGR00730 family)
MLVSVSRLANDNVDRGDLKIANGALREMRNSFARFTPHRERRKASVFGSARTQPDEASYQLAVETGAALAERDWDVITGGGPGIMTAAVEGAGREHSFVVTIRLPFEDSSGPGIVDEDHIVRFRYFFTRKLTFMKESSGYVVFPGGFGTLDETFELLTLVQTGKENPAPIVLMAPPGDTYWERWLHVIEHELVTAGLVSAEDLDLVMVTSSPAEAAEYVSEFYRTYDSMRWVGDELIIRLCHDISDADLEQLNSEFGDIVATPMRRVDVSATEIEDGDRVDLPRLAATFDKRHFARLHQMIRKLGTFSEA